jgi:hypothetical protein
MRFLVSLVSMGAALTLIAASGMMNWVFMTSLGRLEFEQHILGAVSFAVSAFIALLPTLLLWAWRERRTLYVILSLPVFLGFVAFSLSSAIGFSALNRGSLDEDRRLASARLVEIKRVIEATGTALKELENIRSVTVLREGLRGLEEDRRWQSSKSCEAATADASRTFCKDYFDVKAEVAKAGERERLAAKLAELNGERSRLEDKGAGREADNQTAVLAQLLGLPASDVERGLTLFLAVLVEIGAALGIYFATGQMRSEPGSYRRPCRGPFIIEGNVVEFGRRDQAPPAPLKQIAAPVGQQGPRRVPHLKQS